MLWKKSVGENRVDCSRGMDCSTVMVLDRGRVSTRRLEVSGWKTKECSIRKELARRNIELDEIREIGRGFVVQ